MSAGPGYTCGLETDRTIICIGDAADLPPVNERFAAGYDDTSGFEDTCGAQTDGSIVCRAKEPATAPPGSFTQVSAGWDHSCGIRTDGSVVCWGDIPYSAETLKKLEESPPSGPFTQVSASVSSQCGLRTDGSVVCWGENAFGLDSVPSGPFSQVSAGIWYGCGLRTDRTITCWGENDSGQADAPPGCSLPCLSAVRTRVGCVPTGRWNVGVAVRWCWRRFRTAGMERFLGRHLVRMRGFISLR